MKKLIILLLLLTFASNVDAQKRKRKKRVTQRFSAGLIGGFTFSQIDGDLYTGYDHRRPTFGIKVSSYINEYLSFDANLLYANKGATIQNETRGGRPLVKKERLLHFSYVEVPFLFIIKPNGYGSKLFLETGFSYNRMLNSKIEERIFDYTFVRYKENIEPEMINSEIAFVNGIGSYLYDKLSVAFRMSWGITKIYVNEDPWVRTTVVDVEPIQVLFLRNYYASLTVRYDIF